MCWPRQCSRWVPSPCHVVPCQPLINVSRVVCGALAFWMLEAVVMGEACVVTPFLPATLGGIQGTSKVLHRSKTAKCPLCL